jgi:hypothetical protein
MTDRRNPRPPRLVRVDGRPPPPVPRRKRKPSNIASICDRPLRREERAAREAPKGDPNPKEE